MKQRRPSIDTLAVKGREYKLHYFAGTVVAAGKQLETRVHGSGGGSGGGYSSPVSVSSTTIVHDQLFLVNQSGVERSFQVQNFDIACRPGHELIVVWAIAKGAKEGPYITIHNYTTGTTSFHDGALQGLFHSRSFLTGLIALLLALPTVGISLLMWIVGSGTSEAKAHAKRFRDALRFDGVAATDNGASKADRKTFGTPRWLSRGMLLLVVALALWAEPYAEKAYETFRQAQTPGVCARPPCWPTPYPARPEPNMVTTPKGPSLRRPGGRVSIAAAPVAPHVNKVGRATAVVPIHLDATETRGPLANAVVRRVIDDHVSDLQSCYKDVPPHSGQLKGRITIKLLIGPTGVVRNARITSTVQDKDAESCIVSAAQGWVFPAFENGGAVVVTQSVVLGGAVLRPKT